MNRNNTFSPCKGCEERYAGCHSECEKYIEIKKKWRREKDILERAKHKDRILYRKRNSKWKEV